MKWKKEEWKKVELKKVIEKPLSGEWGKEPEINEEFVKVIRSTNFTNEGKIDLLKNFALRHIEPKKVSLKSLKIGDILIEKSGGSPTQPVGRVLFFELSDSNYLFSNFTSLLRPKSGNFSKFIFYSLFAYHKFGITERFQNKTTGIINLQLDRYLSKIQIPLPPLSTQQQIADILDKADALRQKTQAQLDALDDLAQSVFLEMFGDPVLNEKGWEVRKLGEVANISSGSTPSRTKEDIYFNGNIPWVKTGEVNGSKIFETEENITKKAISDTSCKTYPVNSILIAMYGQGKTRGNVGLLGVEAATNQACAVIEPCEKYSSIFLFEYLKNSYEFLRSLGRGGNQPNLNGGMIKNLVLLCPPLPLQNQFAAIIENIEAQKASLKESLQESEDLFNGLLQEVFG